MASEEVWNLIHRKLGYEIASILKDRTLSQAELKQIIPYQDIHYQQIDRILTDRSDLDVFQIPPTKRGTKYTLNTQLFSEQELKRIEHRAVARIFDSKEHPTEETTVKPPDVHEHINAANFRSRFSDDYEIPP